MVNRVSQKNQDIPMRTRVAPVPTFCQSAQWIWLPPHRLIASERSLTVRWSFCAKSSRQHLLLSTSTRMTNRHSIFPFRLPATFPRPAMNRKCQNVYYFFSTADIVQRCMFCCSMVHCRSEAVEKESDPSPQLPQYRRYKRVADNLFTRGS